MENEGEDEEVEFQMYGDFSNEIGKYKISFLASDYELNDSIIGVSFNGLQNKTVTFMVRDELIGDVPTIMMFDEMPTQLIEIKAYTNDGRYAYTMQINDAEVDTIIPRFDIQQ